MRDERERGRPRQGGSQSVLPTSSGARRRTRPGDPAGAELALFSRYAAQPSGTDCTIASCLWSNWGRPLLCPLRLPDHRYPVRLAARRAVFQEVLRPSRAPNPPALLRSYRRLCNRWDGTEPFLARRAALADMLFAEHKPDRPAVVSLQRPPLPSSRALLVTGN